MSCPTSRPANYDVWVRGYGLVDSPKSQGDARQDRQPEGGCRARQESGGRAVLPGAVLVRAAAGAAEERFPGHRSEGQRHLAEHQEPGRVDPPGRQHRRLHRLPSARRRGDAHDSRRASSASEDSKAAWDRRIQAGQAGGGMSARFTQVGRQRALAMYADWTDRIAAGELPRPPPPRVRRARSATSSSRCGTGRIRRSTCTTRSRATSAIRPSTPTADLRRARRERRLSARHRSEDEHGEPGEADGPRSGDAELRRSAAGGAVAVLGRRSDLEQQDDGAQLRDGQAGSRVGRGAHPQAGDAGVVPGGIGSSVGEGVPDQPGPARAGDVRPEDEEAHDDRHLLQLGPRELRRQRRAVVVVRPRPASRAGSTRRSGTRRTTRSWRRAGARSSSTTTATASATPTPNRISRRIRRRTSGSTCSTTATRRRRTARCGERFRACRARSCVSSPARIRRRPRSPNTTRCRGTTRRRRCRASRRAAWTSTARASSGRCSRADISRASIAASARARSTVRPPRAALPEGWTLYPLPGPNYKGAVDSGSADSAYYDFVDRFDLLGVGKDVPIATGNLSEGLLALVDGKFLTLRVPYPMGFFAKGMDGRIDNPNGGWKGKAIYTTIATRAPFHAEGGKGTTSKLVKFQVRPDPLAK